MKFCILLLFLADCATIGAQDAVLSWYPLQAGNSWTWQIDSLGGDRTHPTFERWTLEQTVLSDAPDAELGGVLVTMHNRVLSDVTSSDFLAVNNEARRVPTESHLLIFRNCVYLLDGPDAGPAQIAAGYGHARATYHEELVHGTVQPDFCFPLAAGMTWGVIASRGLDPDFVWNVAGLNVDPYGPPQLPTYRLSTRAGSGTLLHRWFTKGIGVVQENREHHGTYEEGRRRLVRARIGGKIQSFDLTPARTPPLGESDCTGSQWQHFARGDGTPFENAAACSAFANYSRLR
jgi:hypothetical protein